MMHENSHTGDLSSFADGDYLDQKSLEKLVDLFLDTVDPTDQVSFYGWVLSGQSHIQHQQCLALAQYGRCTPETARLWLKGATGCTCTLLLYLKCRIRFESEYEMARSFCGYINRDLIGEARQ